MMDSREDYRQAGFLRALGFGSYPAVVVVDAVSAYVEPESPMYLDSGADAIEAMAALIGAARQHDVPVAFTTVVFDSVDGADAPLFFKKVPSLRVFVRGSALGAIPDAIAPLKGEAVFEKKYASAFFGTTLATWLALRGVDTVLVAGFSTSGCIRATALDTLQHGYRPMVVREAVADRSGGPHEANLFDLEAKYADVVTLPDAVQYLKQHGAARGAHPSLR